MDDNKEQIKLLLLPYAGGSALFYSRWVKYLSKHIKMVPIELPGRGMRFKEELCDDMSKTIEDIWHQVKAEITEGRYALFGYCIGTLIVYELLKKIKKENMPEPSHCFLCAYPAPDVPRKGKQMKIVNEEELMEEWINYSNVSRKQLMEKPYLRSMYEVWKSDCTVIDKYYFSGTKEKFDCNITLVNGTREQIFSLNELESWQTFCNKECNSYIVEGKHDFMKTNEKELIQIINKEI